MSVLRPRVFFCDVGRRDESFGKAIQKRPLDRQTFAYRNKSPGLSGNDLQNDLHDFTPGLRLSRRRSLAGFSLIEVMIAAGLFFMATFAILLLVSATLRNAKTLQRGDADAGMAASQVSQMVKTNRQIGISGAGDFGEAYPDYSFEFASSGYRSNGLFRVQIVVKRRGSISPVDTATIWVYDPDAKSVSNQANLH